MIEKGEMKEILELDAAEMRGWGDSMKEGWKNEVGFRRF